MSETKTIVIATQNTEKALFIIAKEAINYDYIELTYTEKYAPIVEYLIRLLTKGLGWLEDERGEKQVSNTRCYYNIKGNCSNPNKLKDNKGSILPCKETIKKTCKYYKPKYDNTITVNYVNIEKVGQAR